MSTHDEPQTTRKAKDIDPNAAFAEALKAKVGYERYADVTRIQEAALQYAAVTMGPAIGTLALEAASGQGRVKGENGWHAFALPIQEKSLKHRHIIDLVIVNETTPGGFLLSVAFKPIMTPEAQARNSELHTQIYAEAEAAGISARATMMEQVLGALRTPKLDTPAKKSQSELKLDPLSYVPLSGDHFVESVSCVVLDMGELSWEGVGPGGRHPDLTSWDASLATDVLFPVDHSGKYQSGKSFEVRTPHTRYDDDGVYSGSVTNSSGTPEIPMNVLSDMLKGFPEMSALVDQQNLIAQNSAWFTTGVGHFPLLEEAGYAAVNASGGFYDDAVTARITRFSQDIAAYDVAANMNDWRKTAERMISEEFTSKKKTFDCNDGRDIAYAGRTQSGVFQVTETQHGTFRVDMTIGDDDQISRVEIRKGKQPIGRFINTPDGLVSDYGASEGYTEIPHRIDTIRNVNTVVGSLSSVACVFEDERRVDDEEMRP